MASGLTANLGDESERDYIIGAEGAALIRDTSVIIYSEWVDEDGTALPDQLGLDDGAMYGYTGRIAHVVDDNTLGVTSDSQLESFPIAPGRRTQVVDVGSNLSTAGHFYVHVVGKPQLQECPPEPALCADFSETGEDVGNPAPYDSRPSLLAPFYVPLFDEDQHWQAYSAYRQLQQNYDDSDLDAIEPVEPLPAYAWQLRPEYQFSKFELDLHAINRANIDEESGVAITSNLLSSSNPIIASSDDYIEALYSSFTSEFDRLAPLLMVNKN